MALVLNREQRDTLWREMTDYLDRADFGDVSRYLDSGRSADAQRLAHRFRDAIRLLDDLGWERVDLREIYELVLPGDQLERLVRLTLSEADDFLHDQDRAFERSAWERPGFPMSDDEWDDLVRETRREIDHNLDVCLACRAVLERGS
jgi:hypothetical protein